VGQVVEEARRDGVYVPRSLTTAYKNAISPEQEQKSPGNRAIEHRLRSIIRWNAGLRRRVLRRRDRKRRKLRHCSIWRQGFGTDCCTGCEVAHAGLNSSRRTLNLQGFHRFGLRTQRT
jgi:hypothetical protein